MNAGVIREITAEHALWLAKYQRPGVVLVVGPTLAREEWVKPLSRYALYRLIVAQSKNAKGS